MNNYHELFIILYIYLLDILKLIYYIKFLIIDKIIYLIIDNKNIFILIKAFIDVSLTLSLGFRFNLALNS